MDLHRRVDREELARLVGLGAEEARRSGEGEAISRWCAADAEPEYLARLVYHVSDLLALGGAPPDRFVLVDAGGGSGLLAVVACLMGAARAFVVDTNRHLMDFLLLVAPQLGPRARVDGLLRDVSRTGLPAACADVVLCNEALSHMLDLEGFLEEAHRVLRPGGRLLISDSNNEDNPRVRRARRRAWGRFESTGASGEPGELFLKRRELIRDRFPGVGDSLADEIAAETFGMTGEEVARAAARRLRGEPTLPSYFDGRRCPVDPLSNQCADRLFRPYQLGRRIALHGMRVRVRAHFATRPPYRALNGVWGALSPLTLPLSGAFKIVASKEGGA